MRKGFIILLSFILNIYCQRIEDIVECNDMKINQQELEKMSIKGQEDYVNKFFVFFKWNLM
jgi:hypothetical protein